MKTILAILILFSAIALPVLGELTVDDIEKIDTKIKESEARTKEHINTQIESVKKNINTQIESVKENINTQIESVDKRLSLVTTLIVGLIALIVLAVSIPQILMARQQRPKDDTPQIEEFTQKLIMQLVRDQMTELMTELMTEFKRDQEQKIETLTQEIETLKQQQIVRP